MTKLWLDDERDPLTYGENFKVPDKALRVLQSYGRGGWIWCKTIEDAKKVLSEGDIDVASFDNDLGAGQKEGYELVNWLEEKAFTEPNFPIPNHMFVHSHNVDRIKPMEQAISNIKRFQKKE